MPVGGGRHKGVRVRGVHRNDDLALLPFGGVPREVVPYPRRAHVSRQRERARRAAEVLVHAPRPHREMRLHAERALRPRLRLARDPRERRAQALFPPARHDIENAVRGRRDAHLLEERLARLRRRRALPEFAHGFPLVVQQLDVALRRRGVGDHERDGARHVVLPPEIHRLAVQLETERGPRHGGGGGWGGRGGRRFFVNNDARKEESAGLQSLVRERPFLQEDADPLGGPVPDSVRRAAPMLRGSERRDRDLLPFVAGFQVDPAVDGSGPWNRPASTRWQPRCPPSPKRKCHGCRRRRGRAVSRRPRNFRRPRNSLAPPGWSLPDAALPPFARCPRAPRETRGRAKASSHHRPARKDRARQARERPGRRPCRGITRAPGSGEWEERVRTCDLTGRRWSASPRARGLRPRACLPGNNRALRCGAP